MISRYISENMCNVHWLGVHILISAELYFICFVKRCFERVLNLVLHTEEDQELREI
jgi:hypothetical protein